jgi:gluconolactonase
MPTPISVRVSRIALLAPLAFALPGCKMFHRDGDVSSTPAADATTQPSTQPADNRPRSRWPHGGAMANVTNMPYRAENACGFLGTIERLDPGLDSLIPPEAIMQKLVEGLDWAEGPVWSKQKNILFFSDVPQNVVYQWDEETGVHVYLRPSGYTGVIPRGEEPGSNGLTIDSLGRLVLCQHGDRAVSRLEGIQPSMNNMEPMHPVFVPLVDRYEGKRLNSPNDLCFDSRGNLFFTDPPYGLLSKDERDPAKEIPFQGVYRLSNKGELTLLTKEMTRPNGIALSPDERTLYVANSDPKQAVIMAFAVKPDGTLGEGRVFFDATAMVKNNKGLPDGMKVDKQGNLWATGPGGVFILSPDGKHLGTLRTGEATANVAWGDDGSTLYICADSYIARLRTNARGW